jgi:hypothetical protein
MTMFQLSLPKAQSADAFIAFMQDQFFPAVRKGPTRSGQVEGLELLQAQNVHAGDDLEREFLLDVGWAGIGGVAIEHMLHVDDKSVDAKFKAFKAKLTRLGDYTQAASWSPGA